MSDDCIDNIVCCECLAYCNFHCSLCALCIARTRSSLDCTVRVWDYEKRLIRTVTLNLPSYSVLNNSPLGDLLITQVQLFPCTHTLFICVNCCIIVI